MPFVILYLYAFCSRLRFSKRVTAFISAALEAGTGLVFALAVSHIRACFPNVHTRFHTTGLLFICLLISCLLGHSFMIKANWNKRLFVILFIMNGALPVTAICACLHIRFLPIVLLLNVAALFPLWLLLKFYLLPMEYELNAKDSEYLTGLSLLLFLVLSGVFAYSSHKNLFSHPRILLLYVTILLTILAVYFLLFKIYCSAHAKYRQMKYQMDLVNKQYKQIQQNIEASRRMRHDLIYHMCTLRGFLIDGETKKAEEYLMQYSDSAEQFEILHVCEYPVINILTGYYHSLSKKHHIRFIPCIHITGKLAIHNSDVSILLGNLLQNAIEAAGRIRGRRPTIRFTMACAGNMLVITVDNSFDGMTRRRNRQYLSTKPGHMGMGLKSLADIAEKYGGGIEFSHDGNIFHSSVMLRCVSNPSQHSSTLL